MTVMGDGSKVLLTPSFCLAEEAAQP